MYKVQSVQYIVQRVEYRVQSVRWKTENSSHYVHKKNNNFVRSAGVINLVLAFFIFLAGIHYTKASRFFASINTLFISVMWTLIMSQTKQIRYILDNKQCTKHSFQETTYHTYKTTVFAPVVWAYWYLHQTSVFLQTKVTIMIKLQTRRGSPVYRQEKSTCQAKSP